MIHKPINFVKACLTSESRAEDIYNFIDQWHESDATMPLPEYLGMTADEYVRWLENPQTLGVILRAHGMSAPMSPA